MYIYFDLDGTLADLYSVNNWLKLLREENPQPYKEAKPLVNVENFNHLCNLLTEKGYEIGVISWLSKFSSQNYKNLVRAAKREWIKENFSACGKKIHLVQYGTPKHYVVNPKGAFLIDDEERNGISWQSKGGYWIDPKKKNIETFLYELLLK